MSSGRLFTQRTLNRAVRRSPVRSVDGAKPYIRRCANHDTEKCLYVVSAGERIVMLAMRDRMALNTGEKPRFLN